MYNQFQPTTGEFLTGIYFRYDKLQKKYDDFGVKFFFKQFNKSGRGVAKGQDSNLDNPVEGLMTPKGKFAIQTTANLPFKVQDRIVLVGLAPDGKDLVKLVRETGTDRSSTNNLAML